MKQAYDPPSGWLYGFPKEWPEDLEKTEENITKQLTADGYPVSDVTFAAKNTRFLFLTIKKVT